VGIEGEVHQSGVAPTVERDELATLAAAGAEPIDVSDEEDTDIVAGLVTVASSYGVRILLRRNPGRPLGGGGGGMVVCSCSIYL